MPHEILYNSSNVSQVQTQKSNPIGDAAKGSFGNRNVTLLDISVQKGQRILAKQSLQHSVMEQLSVRLDENFLIGAIGFTSERRSLAERNVTLLS